MLTRVRGGAVNEGVDLQRIAWEGVFYGPVAVAAYLADGTPVFINDAMIELLGHAPEALEAKGWIVALYPEPIDQERTRKIIDEVLTREPRRHQRNITRGDGTQRLVDMFSTPFQLRDGRRGVITAVVDMTGLPEPVGIVQSHGIDQLLEKGAEALARFDARTGKCLFASRSVERLTGFSPAEIVADPKLLRRQVLPDYLAAYDQAVRRCTEGEAQWTILGFKRKDGDNIVLHQAFYPVRDASGAVVVVEAVARDVTAVKAMEKQLEQTIDDLRVRNEELASLDRLKSRLLANVSHELRTPLVSIKGYNQLLLRGALGPLTERQRRGLETAGTNTDRLIELIETLLDFAHREEGRLKIDKTRLDLRLVLRDTLGQMVERIRARELDLSVDLGDDSLEVQGDHARLVQVFKALISNAEKFCEGRGGITIAAHRQGNDAMVSVKDTGIGIPIEAQEKIFDRFYQVDSSPTRRFGGTGLGLALAREIVGLHGGRITVDSSEGKGATFRVLLPLDRKEEPARDVERALLLVGATGERLPQLRVLLESHGFAVLEAPTPADLVRRARRHRPDAVVLSFPIEDVTGALAHLRGEGDTHSLPVIAVVDGDDRGEALTAADFAVTPEELDRLPSRLRRLLGLSAELERGEPPRVMIVDDEPGILDFTRFVLEREGYLVQTAVSGEAAIEQIDGRCDLVILDVILQGSDGIEICRRIKKAPATREVPVMVITARIDGDVRRDSFRAGAEGFLLKPFSVDDFLRQVRLHLRDPLPAKTLDTQVPQD